MPGFESKRFVNIDDSVIESLMCGICLGIVNKPFVGKCCKQLYCFDCINQWLRCSNTCPYDRTQLSSQDLQMSEKHWTLMENFQIHCDYQSLGCEETVKLRDLSKHLNQCIYNTERKCNVCFLTMGDIKTHNCIELLIKEKEKLRLENIALISKIEENKSKSFDDERHFWDHPLYCI